jgi:hypothetical protein
MIPAFACWIASTAAWSRSWVFDNAHTYNIRVVNLSLQETTPSADKDSPLDLAVAAVGQRCLRRGLSGEEWWGQIDYAPANDPLVETVGLRRDG